jgi:hypothetical protein
MPTRLVVTADTADSEPGSEALADLRGDLFDRS